MNMAESNYLGKRLRKRRTEMGYTLQELAECTELTPSFISQIERGVTNPSLASLERIANALKVQVMYFMTEDPSKGNRLTRDNNRPRVMMNNFDLIYEVLTPDLTGSFEGVIIYQRPGARNAVRSLPVDTEELYYVLEGELLVGIDEEEILLKKGDSFHVLGTRIRKLVCSGDQPVTYLAVISPPVF